ncbi:helix-turn-helix domain-containing protein [Zhouia amylolytica]|uniref:helix-turn-helix domain-containing protein n=1 Tax=Zhouia amylolytica TaxID=376730 RepID=UPI0020CF00FB|nr:helix-turn-helix domain-containing protein [Zhouia amylolytica]MCQ0112257.1 AraC family transcriptional regulator [Zhouia amylolytica]
MLIFKDFKAFNAYFGSKPPLNDDIDVGIYGDNYLMNSEEVCLDYHRISIKQRIHFPKNHEFEHLNEKSVSAFFYSSPNDTNSWYIEKRFQGYYLQFSKRIINKNKHIFKKLMNFGKHEPLFLNKEEEDEIEQVYKNLLRHYLNYPHEQEILLAYTLVLFSLIESFYTKKYQKKTEEFNRTVVDFHELLKGFYDNNKMKLPTVNYFACQLNITANYLGTIVKRCTGLTAKEHVHRHIIEVAKTRLKSSNKSIRKIALELGFEYQSYFTKVFKYYEGITPTQFRNK